MQVFVDKAIFAADRALDALHGAFERAHANEAVEAVEGTGGVFEHLRAVYNVLRDAHQSLDEPEFERFSTVIHNHAIRETLHTDPFTLRTFKKPRGYAGDAVMMDYIYGPRFCPPVPTDPIALRIFLYTTNSPACRAVRYRKDYLARLIDEVAAERPNPRIVAIAGGHLREASECRALAGGLIKEFVCLDQDEKSLETVNDTYGKLGVTVKCVKARDIIAGRHELGQADLIYAAGLYDYLPDAIAKRLTERMFENLRPGGRLLIPNFLPGIEEVGYMSTIMRWKLIYRSDAELDAVASGIPAAEIASSKMWHDPDDNIAFLQIARK